MHDTKMGVNIVCRGWGRATPHVVTKDNESGEGEVPKVSMDYFYMSTEEERAMENPFITMLDESTGQKYARATGQKGLGNNGEMDWLIVDMAEELKAWGHPGGERNRLILKCDIESPIRALRDALAKYHGGVVIPEDPAKGGSQSNGRVEEAGKTVREHTRVFKEQLEDKASIKLKSDSVIVLWMIRWAAIACTKYKVGKDGKIPHGEREDEGAS